MVLDAIWYFLRFRASLERNQPLMSMGELVRFLNSIQSPPWAVELLMASLTTTDWGLMPGSATPGAPPVRLLGRQLALWLSGLLGSCGVGIWPSVGSRTTRLYPPPLVMGYQSLS